jgi:hypothetical protein
MNEIKSEEILFSNAEKNLSIDEQKLVVELYKTLVDMADKVSQRRQTNNTFYLSINTALISISTYIFDSTKHKDSVQLIAGCGVLISLAWIRNIQSYKDLNSGKFHVITQVEKLLPIRPFSAEWEFLGRGNKISRYRPFSNVEILVPYIFFILHIVEFIRF